jgi:predicted MFS family arabinose efflux permease
MPATTRTVGLLLIVLGLASYFLTGRTSITALIPAFFGAVFVILALVARNEHARKHAMHAAVALGLLGALASLGRAVPAVVAGELARPAVLAQLVMGGVLAVYVALGVKSFRDARRARVAREVTR